VVGSSRVAIIGAYTSAVALVQFRDGAKLLDSERGKSFAHYRTAMIERCETARYTLDSWCCSS
jgi:hypothetical protein